MLCPVSGKICSLVQIAGGPGFKPKEARIFTVDGVTKIFGKQTEDAYQLLKQGASKTEIFEQTGQTVGVHDVSLEIRQGEVFVIMGLSGSGKSTLVRLFNRIIEPTAGQVFYNNQDITHLDKKHLRQLRREKMSMVFQSFALLPHYTVLENVAFGLEIAGMGKDERRQQALTTLDKVGLKPQADLYPRQLSGGMQQRVGLARALAVNPEILLMDEAFSALDPLIRTEMQDELLRLQQAEQRTIVFISHDLDEAVRLGDRIGIMESGRIIQVGTPQQLIDNPVNDYVQQFFRQINIARFLEVGEVAVQKREQGDNELVPIYQAEPHEAFKQLQQSTRARYGVLLAADDRYGGLIAKDAVTNVDPDSLADAVMAEVATLPKQTKIDEAITQVRRHDYPLPVLDQDGRYLGCLSPNIVLETLDRHE